MSRSRIMNRSTKNTPSREDINLAVSRFLEKGGQIEHQRTVKQGLVSQMLEEHGWNNDSSSESDEELMHNFTGILGVEDV